MEREALAQRLYRALDEHTGGIEDFISRGRYEVWGQPGHHDWHIEGAPHSRTVTFGFFSEAQDDDIAQRFKAGDTLALPGHRATIRPDRTIDSDSIRFDDIVTGGIKVGPEIPDNELEMIVRRVEEMTRRKRDGEVVLLDAGSRPADSE
jgi:hypothetical protein